MILLLREHKTKAELSYRVNKKRLSAAEIK